MKKFGGWLATAALLLIGCQSDTPVVAETRKPTKMPQGVLEKTCVGVWSADQGKTVLAFDQDGVFRLKIDQTVDMRQGGGMQRIQRTDEGRWTTDNGRLFLEHSDGLVLSYRLEPENKKDEIHLWVPGMKEPTIYRRFAEKKR